MRRALEWGLLLTTLAAGATSAAVVGDGQRAYDHGRFEEARRIWAPLAEAGDAEAQVRLGLLFDLGQGVPRDPAAAYRWYLRAAEAGLAQAQFNVAVMQDSGLVGPRDPVAAAGWYAKAAAQGHPRAQYNLGQLYSSGDGVPRSLAEAAAWFRAAAEGGVSAAADRLAEVGRDLPEPAPPATPVLTIDAPPEVSEGAGELVVRLELSAQVDTAVTVIYSTLDGEALAGADYRAEQGVLSLSRETPSGELRVVLLDDDRAEADETFYFFISAVPPNVTISQKWTAVIVHDDDQAPPSAGTPATPTASSL